MRVHYKIQGLVGNSAKTRIETEVPDLEGVNWVSVDMKDHTVTVDFDEGAISSYDIEVAINDTGPYKVKRVSGGF